ncbi:MAG: HAD hydrolase-like protein [Patescibacteria group bacterium]|nr:HAD hydrolase-like protein [Patescibacteria group bacterium]
MLLIFDFDGTLYDSLPCVHEGVCAVFEYCELPLPTLVDFVLKFKAPYEAFYRERGVTIPLEDIERLFRAKANRDTIPLFPDVIEAMQRLAAAGHTLAIVSGNMTANVLPALARGGIRELFTTVRCSHQDKVQAFSDVVHDLSFAPDDALVIGDSMIDVSHARQAGLRSVAIVRYPELACVSAELITGGALGVIKCLTELDSHLERALS